MENDLSAQAATVDYLRRHVARAKDGAEIETHISHLFLIDDIAYKLKKAHRFDFLDFSTLDARKHFCHQELKLNSRTAPALYIDVLPITQNSIDHDLPIGHHDNSPVVDWVVRMHRFDQNDLLSCMAADGRLTLSIIQDLADQIIQFHDAAEQHNGYKEDDYYGNLIASISHNLRRAPAGSLKDQDIDALEQMLGGHLAHHRALIDQRAAQGMVRSCHGDLHLANIIFYDGQPLPFDCIEFSDDIANIDILYDLAFPLMDLLRLDLTPHANLLLNRYFEAERHYEALALIPFFMSLRAGIRAMVAALAAQDNNDIQDFVTLALQLGQTAPAHLIAIGGLSGSGKSTFSQNMAPQLTTETGKGAGAIILRTDGIRKRMFGKAPERPLPPEAYRPDVSRKVYGQMMADARAALRAGQTVICDATHVLPTSRTELEELATDLGVPFTGFWMDASPDTLRNRVNSRQHDASDATLAVLESQLQLDIGPMDWHRLDSSRPIDELRAEALQLIYKT